MIGQFFTQRGNLLGSHRAGAVAPLTPLVRENVGNLLVSQCFVPGLHHRSAEFLAFHCNWALQTFEDNHRRTPRAAGCKFRTSQRRILPRHAKPVGLVTCLAIGRENLFAAIARRKFRRLLCALRSSSFFHHLWLAAVWVQRLPAEVSGVPTEIRAAKKYCEAVNCDQPDGERLAAHARFAFLSLHCGVHFMNVGDLAVVHALARTRLGSWCALVHFAGCAPGAGDGAWEAAAGAADRTSFRGCD